MGFLIDYNLLRPTGTGEGKAKKEGPLHTEVRPEKGNVN